MLEIHKDKATAEKAIVDFAKELRELEEKYQVALDMRDEGYFARYRDEEGFGRELFKSL